ncbi:MAG: tyrosine--tRNA ligase [Candidatus Paceibacterota bacterium]|jgi:tyrosyl-tRNA synthetase
MKFMSKDVSTDSGAIKEFLERGIEAVFPNKADLERRLMSGKKLRIYLGIDPTGPTVHLGHVIPLLRLARLQEMGHEVILLIGDFTAMIGDPTDKSAARKKLSRKEVLSNLKLYKKQAGNILSFSGPNAAKLKFNSKWLSKLSFAEILDIASHMTADQMRKRDMFRKREEEGKPTYLHEFLYPLMQGYDSVAMDVDAEVGGNDQTFNMLAGRDLMKSLKNKDKFVIATKLLVDPSGKKMGKTEGNMIALSDSARDMFGKVMSWPDPLIVTAFETATRVSMSDINEIRKSIGSGANPRDAKLRLAETVVSMYYGEKAAKAERDNFFKAFSNKEMPDDTSEIAISRDSMLSDALVANKIVSSKSDFKRLVQEKAIRDMKTDKVVEKFDEKVTADLDLRVGKHRFVKIRVK